MRPQKKLSEDLEHFERYLATEHVIKPKELKKILKRLKVKAEIMEWISVKDSLPEEEEQVN